MGNRAEKHKQDTVVVAGANGFVGKALLPLLLQRFNVIALGRSAPRASNHPNLEWRQCDLFSLLQTERAVEGAKYAVYLVHSMAPSELTQAGFRDIDWILADNFSRACDRAEVEQIIYLGGLMPAGQGISEHLTSRYEVAQVLGARGPAVTVIQAGLIIGPGGSSFQMMYKLVERLPVMVCPKWTSSQTQPIALEDVINILMGSIGRQDFYNEWFDVGGPDRMSYIQMMRETAQVMGLKRRIGSIPVFSLWLSLGWIQIFTGASRQLIRPLIESLRHDMVVQENRLQKILQIEGVPFVEALKKALLIERLEPIRKNSLKKAGTTPPTKKMVCSIQRLTLPKPLSAQQIASLYAEYLRESMGPWLKVDVDNEQCMRFRVVGLSKPILVLRYAPNRSEPTRALYYIDGGLLADMQKMEQAKIKGRLEFRISDCGKFVLAAIMDFAPKLPWSIYRLTQAPFHLRVMKGFDRFLNKTRTKQLGPSKLHSI